MKSSTLILCLFASLSSMLFSCKKDGDLAPQFLIDTVYLGGKEHWHTMSVHPAYMKVDTGGWLKLVDSSSVLGAQAKMVTMDAARYMSKDFTLNLNVRLNNLCNSLNLDRLTPPNNDGFGESNETNDDNINEAGFSMAIVFPNYPYRIIFAILKAQDYNTSKNLEIWRVINGSKKGYYIFQRIYSGKAIQLNKVHALSFHITYKDGAQWNGTLSIDKKVVVKSTFGMSNTYAGLGSWLFQCKGTTPHPVVFEVKDMTIASIKDN
ncbi:hypothetical protein UNH65_28215 [Chitinophaga sp. 180180018-2]|nr:hypothetical protein [Chitinophaga sp. 212800010-3]